MAALGNQYTGGLTFGALRARFSPEEEADPTSKSPRFLYTTLAWRWTEMAGGIKQERFPAAVLGGLQMQRHFRLVVFLCSDGVDLLG